MNEKKYIALFSECFGIEENQVSSAEYKKIEQWDSVGHMTLVAAVEDSFGIELDVEDIMGFTTFEKGKEILRKYNIVL